ncbi:MAG: hypothetical protein CMC55_00910 [Flavobacteriaceae bacterium]|nr:hypothetical protein [Flavobacteriaceae bacterium]
MSVQLIVYPQSTAGSTSTSGGIEFIADGQTFSTMGPSAAVPYPNWGWLSTIPPWGIGNGGSIIMNNMAQGPPPEFFNTWYTQSWVVPGTFAFPNYSSNYIPYPSGGDCIFISDGSLDGNGNVLEGHGGIYQHMSGLTSGAGYVIRIGNNTTSANVTYDIEVFNRDNNTSITTQNISGGIYVNGTDIVHEFTATGTNITVFFCLYDPAASLTLTSVTFISVKDTASIVTTTIGGFTADELHDQEILDLYEDESIPLTLSVDDFKDVATKTQSYSKAFNLPATKKNNKVFGSLYEVTKQAGTGTFRFNPYARTSMVLKENGFIVFEGFLRLIDIIDKDGEISYNVNLYSETVAFMDVLKDKLFYELPLCELDHTYDLDSIQASQTGVLPLTNQLQAGSFAGAAGATTTDVLKYPLVDWTGSMRREATTREIDLGATDGNPSMSRLEDGFRPFIKLKYLVDNIFADAGFTYDSDFFDSTYFNKLFMDFNWGEERDGSAPNRNDFTRRMTDSVNTSINTSWTNIPVSLPLTTSPGGGSTALWDNGGYKLVSDVNNLVVTGKYRIQVENTATINQWSCEMRICKFNSNGSVLEEFDREKKSVGAGGGAAISGSYETVLNNGDWIQMEARDFNASATIYVSDTTYSYLTCYYNNNAVGVCPLLQAARGELAQWDFFKGLTTMFNLITLQDPVNPSNLLIEPYDDVFAVNPDIKTIDWTKKVDISDIKLKPLDLERRVIFQFEEDEEDYPFMQYKAATAGYLYGSGIVDIDGFDVFQGDKEVIASPFAATVVKNLFDDIFDFYAPVIYGSNEEATEFGSIKNLPRILYDTGMHTTQYSFYIPAQNGGALSNETSYSLFSHTDVVPSASTDVDLSFSVVPYQLMIPQSVAPLPNLFTNYYFNYFAELYNTDVKSMNIKVLLTPEDIANFNFYDKILIKNREYRVDKLNYKPNDLSTVEFILIT